MIAYNIYIQLSKNSSNIPVEHVVAIDEEIHEKLEAGLNTEAEIYEL